MVNKIIGIVALTLCASIVKAFEVDNFKSGLVCTDGKTFGWVCHEVEDIYVTGQSQCTFNKESIPCTWHGFSFDYKNYKKGQVVSCEYTQTAQANMGNPESIIEEGSNSGSYEFELDNQESHFFNPQYVGLAVGSIEESLQSNYTVCKSGEKVLFEFSYRLHFPVAEEK